MADWAVTQSVSFAVRNPHRLAAVLVSTVLDLALLVLFFGLACLRLVSQSARLAQSGGSGSACRLSSASCSSSSSCIARPHIPPHSPLPTAFARDPHSQSHAQDDPYPQIVLLSSIDLHLPSSRLVDSEADYPRALVICPATRCCMLLWAVA